MHINMTIRLKYILRKNPLRPELCLICFFFLLLEKITNTPFCMYIFRFTWVAFYLFPETAHMNVHSADITRIIIASHMI